MEQKTFLMMVLSRYLILGEQDDMTGYMSEDNIVRSKGTMEIVLNPPKEAFIRLKKLEDMWEISLFELSPVVGEMDFFFFDDFLKNLEVQITIDFK